MNNIKDNIIANINGNINENINEDINENINENINVNIKIQNKKNKIKQDDFIIIKYNEAEYKININKIISILNVLKNKEADISVNEIKDDDKILLKILKKYKLLDEVFLNWARAQQFPS